MLLKKLKRLKQYEKSMRIANEMLDIQGHNGNYNYDSYMLGIYNGMEYIIALFETREPIFKSGKDIEFISELQQENQELKKQNKKYKEVIDKAIEYINHYETIRGYYEYEENGYDEYNYDEDFKKELLDILKEVSE